MVPFEFKIKESSLSKFILNGSNFKFNKLQIAPLLILLFLLYVFSKSLLFKSKIETNSVLVWFKLFDLPSLVSLLECVSAGFKLNISDWFSILNKLWNYLDFFPIFLSYNYQILHLISYNGKSSKLLIYHLQEFLCNIYY